MDDLERQLFARGGIAQKRQRRSSASTTVTPRVRSPLARSFLRSARPSRPIAIDTEIVVAEQQHALALERAVLQHQQRAAHRGVGAAGRLIQRDIDRRRAGDDFRQTFDLGLKRIRDDDAMSGAGRAGDVELRSHAEIALDEFAAVAGQRQPLLAFEQPGLFQLAPHRARDRKRQPRLARGILQAQRAGAVDRAKQSRDAGGSLAQTRRLRYQLQNRRRGHYFLISLAIRLTRALSHTPVSNASWASIRIGPDRRSVSMLMTHILAELYECPEIIHDATALAEAAKRAAQSVGATIVGEYEVRYVPHGLTIAIFLGESHIVLTTWPEFRSAAGRYPACAIRTWTRARSSSRSRRRSARWDKWWCTRRRAGSPRRRETADSDRRSHATLPDSGPASPPNQHRAGELQSKA